MVTRREFIQVGVGVGVAATAFALPGDKFRWAMSSHMWA